MIITIQDLIKIKLAWASSQSQVLDNKETFLQNIKKFEKQYPEQQAYLDHPGLMEIDTKRN